MRTNPFLIGPSPLPLPSLIWALLLLLPYLIVVVVLSCVHPSAVRRITTSL